MPRHPPGDGVDGELHLYTLFFENVGHFAKRVLRLRDRHAVTGDDDDLLRLFEHEGRIVGAALLVGALFARFAVSATARIRAEAACDHAEEAAVHRTAHDVAEDRTRRSDQRAGDDHRRIAEREAHRRRGPARIAVQHRHHDWHVRPADGNDQQEADQEGRDCQRDDKGQVRLRPRRVREEGRQDENGRQRAEIDDVPRRQKDRRSAHPPGQFQEGDDRARKGDRPDRDAEAHFDLADRIDRPAWIEQIEGCGIKIGSPTHQHRGKTDQRVEARHQLGHRRHRDASGDGDADQRADGNRGEDFAEGCPIDDENFGAETKRGPVTEF